MIRDSARKALKFFKARFPDKDIEFEIQCGYFGEWIERFETGNPEIYMDYESLRIWEKIK